MSDFAAYVFYVNRPDLLERSLESFPDTLMHLTVINNSGGAIPNLAHKGCRIYRPLVPLTYSQSMNLMLEDCLSLKADFIIHFHSDAYTTNPNAVQELLAKVREYRDSGRRWSCAFSHYDLLWAVNPIALADIGGWDTMFPAYFGDNDARRRWELAGWECIDTGIQGVQHEGSATINSDPDLQFLNGQTFPLYAHLYRQKWGGEPGKEVFTKPFNRDFRAARS